MKKLNKFPFSFSLYLKLNLINYTLWHATTSNKVTPLVFTKQLKIIIISSVL